MSPCFIVSSIIQNLITMSFCVYSERLWIELSSNNLLTSLITQHRSPEILLWSFILLNRFLLVTSDYKSPKSLPCIYQDRILLQISSFHSCWLLKITPKHWWWSRPERSPALTVVTASQSRGKAGYLWGFGGFGLRWIFWWGDEGLDWDWASLWHSV